MDLLRRTVFFGQKSNSKVAIIKTKSATTAFFSSPPLFLLALSFSPFIFLPYCDFAAYRAQKTCLLTRFHSNDIWKFVKRREGEFTLQNVYRVYR